MVTAKLLTIDDLVMLPEDERYELIRGELRPMSPVGHPHGVLLARICTPLTLHVEAEGLGTVASGDVGVMLERDPDTVLAPDLVLVKGGPTSFAHLDDGFITRIPDLVVEIASPSDSRSAMRNKVARYPAAGVPHVWLVEGRSQTVSVFGAGGTERILTKADILEGGDFLPGFRLPVATIFR